MLWALEGSFTTASKLSMFKKTGKTFSSYILVSEINKAQGK